MSRVCYCCGERFAEGDGYYCRDCLLKLKRLFAQESPGIVAEPKLQEHCISCGQWEERRILWTGQTGLFDHEGDGVPICEKCVEEEWGGLLLREADGW